MPLSPLVIVNPAAGGGRAGRLAPRLRRRLRTLVDGDLVETSGPGHAEELGRDAARHGRARVIVAGGDGTLQEVANGLLGAGQRIEATSLGIVPGGSGNDLARSIGLPHRLDEAWRLAIGERTLAVDVLRAESAGRLRWFVSAGGAGFDGLVAAAMARRNGWQRGRVGYLATALAQLWGYRNRTVRVELDGSPLAERSSLLVAFANGPYYGGGMRICPEATVEDGEIDVCVVGDLSGVAAVRQIPALYRGTHVGHPAVEMHRARRVRLEGDPEVKVHLDGEPFGKIPISVEAVRAALRVAR